MKKNKEPKTKQLETKKYDAFVYYHDMPGVYDAIEDFKHYDIKKKCLEIHYKEGMVVIPFSKVRKLVIQEQEQREIND